MKRNIPLSSLVFSERLRHIIITKDQLFIIIFALSICLSMEMFMHMCVQMHLEVKRALGFPRAWVTSSCESPDSAGTWTPVLYKSKGSLPTTESVLQPQIINVFFPKNCSEEPNVVILYSVSSILWYYCKFLTIN